TATSQILITPDGERSMQTYLGACVELDSGDINQEAIQSAKICYLEGYLWDPPKGREALYKAAQTAKSAGRQVALTLSDAWLVDRHRQDFREFIHEAVDILFANELELLSLYETEDFNQALELIRGTVAIAAITRSEKGSILLKRAETHLIPAEKTQIVDTTGAGDLYAAGVLFGLSQGMDLKICGRLGSIAAAEVISHIGPRPQVNLKELAKSKQALAA
ncbi:MAG: adenosine kinase, partial [Dongiaceae bacterium]